MKDASRSRTFVSYEEFRTYLDYNLGDETLRRLFILEDLAVRFVCLLGSRVRIHPTIFARHFTTEDSTMISDNIVALPSIEQSSTQNGLDYVSDYESLHEPAKKKSFTLQYPVTMPHLSAKQHPDPLRGSRIRVRILDLSSSGTSTRPQDMTDGIPGVISASLRAK
jgi:hypothetical protein